MPKHRQGHAHLVSMHDLADHGGAHLAPERPMHTWPGWLILVLAVALIVVVVATLVTVLAVTRSDDTGTDRPPTDSPAPEEPRSSAAEPSLKRCRTVWTAVQEVLTAAEPSMRQWDAHIAAMNKLVAGKITLAQASEFWEQTRVGAHRRYDAFDTADRRFRGRHDRAACAEADPTRPDGETLTACARAVAAADSTLRAARTTLARWSRHLVDMGRLRNGTLSPATAQRLWLHTWHQGALELRAYHQLERESAELRCEA